MADLQSTARPIDATTYPIPDVLRRLTKSFGVYGAANFGIRGLNFLLILVYARYLQPHDYGMIYMAEIVAAFLAIFAGLSLDSAIERMYFQHNHNDEELRSYIGSVTRFGLLWMGIFLVLALAAGGTISPHLKIVAGTPFYPYIALAISTATALQVMQYRLAVFQASSRPRSYAALSIVLFALTAVCCFYGVVLRRGGALAMLEGKFVAAAVTFLIVAWNMRAYLTDPFRWKFVRESLSFSLPLVPHLVMASGLVVADRFILAHYRDLSEVGIYSLAYTFGMVMYLVTQSLCQAWFPIFFTMAGGDEEGRRQLARICSGLAVFLAVLACFGILLAPAFVNLFLDSRYAATAQIVPLVVIGYLFHAFFSLFDLAILQAKRTSSVFVISLVPFATNIALNLAWIPHRGMRGAAWATTLAYAVEALGTFLLAQRVFHLPYRHGEILLSIAVAVVAVWLTQSSWALEWHGLLLAGCVVPAIGLLTLVAGRDLLGAFSLVRSRRAN
jgi:O-antigen/teichoic acid export membrane protein